MAYFFEDGYPRGRKLQNDARAVLEVLEELAQRPSALQLNPDSPPVGENAQ